MELSWLMRLRIAAAVATGAVLIGFLAWPLAASPEPFAAVLARNISFTGKINLAGLAFLAGFIAYFLSWPYGREIGILAAPSGLAVWAVRSGNMTDLVRLYPALPQRQALFAALKWEPVFWLAIVAAGFAGVLLGQKIHPKAKQNKSREKPNSQTHIYLNAAIALVGSGLIAQFCIRIFAQDVSIFDNKLGSVVAQPAAGQIVFAVLASFGIAAFVVKKLLNASYIWPIITSALVTGFVIIWPAVVSAIAKTFNISTYAKQDILQHLVARHPAVFFSNAITSILPVQMVAFGTLGSIAGYWLAVRYDYWRKHEIK